MPDEPTTTPPQDPPKPAPPPSAPKPDSAPQEPSSGGLDDILAKLDEDGRKAVRAELERARGDAAKYRTRASKFGDIDPDRAKAAIEKLDEIEQQNKTEAQKAADAQKAAEQERDAARKELWRERVGRKHGLSDTFVAMLAGDTEEAMDEHGKKIADELDGVRKRPADAVPNTPKPNQSPGSGDSEEFDPEKIAAQALAR